MTPANPENLNAELDKDVPYAKQYGGVLMVRRKPTYVPKFKEHQITGKVHLFRRKPENIDASELEDVSDSRKQEDVWSQRKLEEILLLYRVSYRESEDVSGIRKSEANPGQKEYEYFSTAEECDDVSEAQEKCSYSSAGKRYRF